MKRHIPNIKPIIAGGDARLLKKGSSFVCTLFLSLISLVASTPLFAQFDSAQINGRSIRDVSGAVLPHATLQIQNRLHRAGPGNCTKFGRDLRPESHTSGGIFNHC